MLGRDKIKKLFKVKLLRIVIACHQQEQHRPKIAERTFDQSDHTFLVFNRAIESVAHAVLVEIEHSTFGMHDFEQPHELRQVGKRCADDCGVVVHDFAGGGGFLVVRAAALCNFTTHASKILWPCFRSPPPMRATCSGVITYSPPAVITGTGVPVPSPRAPPLSPGIPIMRGGFAA